MYVIICFLLIIWCIKLVRGHGDSDRKSFESTKMEENKSKLSLYKDQVVPKCLVSDPMQDLQMTSSILSVTSSLTSPVDSGVQLLDSESDIASVMSMSGTGDLDCNDIPTEGLQKSELNLIEQMEKITINSLSPNPSNVMTKSDIANQNVTDSNYFAMYSTSAPNIDYNVESTEEKCDATKDELDKIEPTNDEIDAKADTTQQPNAMHVSVSEEVQETLKDESAENEMKTSTISDEQIVFRRQRKKKSSKSDTPKKRVSFHEDILNSTKIDDIHINHGFITHQPDISMSFFNFDSIRKRDVIKGRYSWAAEGDTPYYQRDQPEREVKSEIYMNSRYSYSSSSTGSVDSSSSNSLSENDPNSDTPHVPSQKKPKGSCLKKRPNKKHIDTFVVNEAAGAAIKQRKSESNLLDSNIFGSLKNILSFSTSVPLAERGVPEGQEDVPVYSSNQSINKLKSNSFTNIEPIPKYADIEKTPEPKKVGNLNIELKNNLKLCAADGFYPNYPSFNVPENIVLCDSNVYEHKGISYSYEYDKFQKSFETVKTPHPKSSSVYQMLLQDLNFFKKRTKEPTEPKPEMVTSSPISDSTMKSSKVSEWSSDTETISDFSENVSSKHLSSPKRKLSKPNHYAVQSFKVDDSDQFKFGTLKPATSKSSLINRFLRNVTMKKLLDAKLQKKQKLKTNKCMELYMKGVKPNLSLFKNLDEELNEEIENGRRDVVDAEDELGSVAVLKIKREIFRDPNEKLINLFKVRSMYNVNGETKPLIVFLSDDTIYICGFKPNQTYSNLFVLPYVELNTVLIGPNAHTIHFSNNDKEMQFFICTGSSEITNDLMVQLEMAMRKHNIEQLPAVRYLNMKDMANLRYSVCKHTAVDKEEEYFHYSIVNVQDINSEPAVTPLGPIKEGPLMFKTAQDTRWETGYFILKGGVLYMLSSPSNRLPMRVLPLSNGACLGAHRTPYALRPHTFELLLKSVTLQLAAPDEYVASDWLQVLVQTASGLYNSHDNNVQACTMLLTNRHVLTMRETFSNPIGSDCKTQTLTCAAISDITTFRIPLAEQSWCILEFACREVHETSGDLVVYFATNTELEKFISMLEMLWTYNNTKGDSFPLTTIGEEEPVNKQCMDSYRILETTWSPFSLSIN